MDAGRGVAARECHRQGVVAGYCSTGLGPARCYHQIKNKSYPKSRYCHGVPGPKIMIYAVGMKAKRADEFPFCVHLMSWEKENVSSEALEAACIACNKYMAKFAGKDASYLRVRVYPCFSFWNTRELWGSNIEPCDLAFGGGTRIWQRASQKDFLHFTLLKLGLQLINLLGSN